MRITEEQRAAMQKLHTPLPKPTPKLRRPGTQLELAIADARRAGESFSELVRRD